MVGNLLRFSFPFLETFKKCPHADNVYCGPFCASVEAETILMISLYLREATVGLAFSITQE